jgi:hypothetical protein
MAMYSRDYDNRMPRSLDQLAKYLDGSRAVFMCPEAKGIASPFYLLVTNVVWEGPVLEPVVFEPASYHGGQGGNVLYNHGHVEWVKASGLPR